MGILCTLNIPHAAKELCGQEGSVLQSLDQTSYLGLIRHCKYFGVRKDMARQGVHLFLVVNSKRCCFRPYTPVCILSSLLQNRVTRPCQLTAGVRYAVLPKGVYRPDIMVFASLIVVRLFMSGCRVVGRPHSRQSSMLCAAYAVVFAQIAAPQGVDRNCNNSIATPLRQNRHEPYALSMLLDLRGGTPVRTIGLAWL